MSADHTLGDEFVRVTLGALCFGMIARHGKIVIAAPCAHWTIGKAVALVLEHYLRRGALLELVDGNGAVIPV